jgi:hypothetical protein
VRAHGKMLPTMFPLAADEMRELGLEHAMRVLPHMQARSEPREIESPARQEGIQ